MAYIPLASLPNLDEFNALPSNESKLEFLLNQFGLLTKELSMINGMLDQKNVKRIKYQLGSGAYLLIDRSGIVAYNGSQEVLNFNMRTGDLTITGTIIAPAGIIGGWTIENNKLYSSTSSYPRVVIDPDNNEVVFYGSATEYIRLGAFSNTNRPYMQFFNGTADMRIDLSATQWEFGPNGTSAEIRINSGTTQDLILDGKDIYLSPFGNTYQSFSDFIDTNGVDLDSQLDDKADRDQAVNYQQYDSATKELHSFNIDGGLLSTVTII